MGRVVAITNQKGGVGKTTTAVNLSAALALEGVRVLVVDVDPQSSATTGFGVQGADVRVSIYDVLLERAGVEEAVRRTEIPGLDLLPATRDLVGAEIELVTLPRREQRLAAAIGPACSAYDWIFVDCPPSLSLLTVNALVAAHGVLVPLQTEYYALEGLTALLDTVRRVREGLNPGLALDGLVLTMFDGRNSLARQVEAEVRAHFGPVVMTSVIPRNVRVSESPSHGKPVLLYDPLSRGALAYRALAQEVRGHGPVAGRTSGAAPRAPEAMLSRD